MFTNKSKFRIYSKPSCPFCDKAKHLLQSLDLEYNEIDVSRDAKTVQWLKSQGFRTVPQIWHISEQGEEEHIGGWQELNVWFSNNATHE